MFKRNIQTRIPVALRRASHPLPTREMRVPHEERQSRIKEA